MAIENEDVAQMNILFKKTFENLTFSSFANRIKRNPFKFYPLKYEDESNTPLEDAISPKNYITSNTQWIVSLAAKKFFKR